MPDDDFTFPPNDGSTINRLRRLDVQVGASGVALEDQVEAAYRAQYGITVEDIVNVVVVKTFRREDFASGVNVVYYRLTGELSGGGED